MGFEGWCIRTEARGHWGWEGDGREAGASIAPPTRMQVKFEEPCVFTGHFAPDELQILPPA